ncbi:MAG: RtcB family protein [Candidatus Kapaibacterium sp.]
MKQLLEQIDPYTWEIPVSKNERMRVPARAFAMEAMLDDISRDRSLQQLMNVATLPGILGHAVVMPDAHEGYGFPIGGVAALDYEEGVISPGGIGYDINCGVRLLKTEVNAEEIKNHLSGFAKELYKAVPSGVGKGGKFRLNKNELDQVLNRGVEWAEEQGFAIEGDRESIESEGRMPQADAAKVSHKAKERGKSQLGTMGAGNHFVEIDRVSDIYDEKAARAFGLYKGQIVIQVHTGSRGLGHQVATDYISDMIKNAGAFGYDLPDRELACAPLSSPIGKDYFAAMAASANFAWVNRQLIMHEIRQAWSDYFGTGLGTPRLLYDVAHNIAKLEEHEIDGKKRKVVVHRKGATRAFPKGHAEVTAKYRHIGQPVLIPGSMGTESYVLAGGDKSMEKSFGSCCHGAGRAMSRSKARKKVDGRQLLQSLQNSGIAVQSGSLKGLAEEAPAAYKNVSSVVNTVELAGIAKKVARLKPLAVIKG